MWRFNLKDEGAIIPFNRAKETVSLGRSKKIWNLPLVALHGRSDQSIVFYAANIYPEQIHEILNSKTLLSRLTGKFVMQKGYLENQDAYLEVNIELQQGKKASERLVAEIQNNLNQSP